MIIGIFIGVAASVLYMIIGTLFLWFLTTTDIIEWVKPAETFCPDSFEGYMGMVFIWPFFLGAFIFSCMKEVTERIYILADIIGKFFKKIFRRR